MDSKSAEAEIRALEDKRYQAMLDGDVATLSDLIASQLAYGHSRGERDDRESYLAKVASGGFKYLEIEHPITELVIFDGTALVVGIMRARVALASGDIRNLHSSGLAVWVREDGRWKFAAYHPTPLAPVG